MIWIDVNDRLPEYDTIVIITSIDFWDLDKINWFEIGLAFGMLSATDEYGKKKDTWYEQTYPPSPCKVASWMPIPALPTNE